MRFQFPIPDGTGTSRFDEPRPISNPGRHIHGAVDIAAPSGTPIFAPEGGHVYYFFACRPHKQDGWNHNDIPAELEDFPFRGRFYDLYGGIVVLRGRRYVHLFTHSFRRQLWNCVDDPDDWLIWEDKAIERFPINGFISRPLPVRRCSLIGQVGDAGYSSGPHCHYEIHHGWKDEAHADRVDPMKIHWEYDL